MTVMLLVLLIGSLCQEMGAEGRIAQMRRDMSFVFSSIFEVGVAGAPTNNIPDGL